MGPYVSLQSQWQSSRHRRGNRRLRLSTRARMPPRAGTALIGSLIFLNCWGEAQAQVQHTQIELAMLPDYCQARLGGDEQAKRVWLQRMGQNFYHLHHYCSGLTAVRRASNAADARKRTENLELAVKEFDYVLKNWTPDFYLVRSAEQQRAFASAMLGRPVK